MSRINTIDGASGRILPRLALAVLASVGTLVLVEGALRLSGRFPSRTLRSVNQAQYDRIPGIWAPNQNFIDRSVADLPHRVVTNSLGLRGAETELTSSKPRALFLGDSFTFGLFVDHGETLVDSVQREIGNGIEALNGGVNGSTVLDQRVFLERLLALQPEVVLLVYSENDLSDLKRRQPLHERLEKNRSLKSGLLGPIYLYARDTSLFSLGLKTQSVLRAWRAGPKPRRPRALRAHPSPRRSSMPALDAYVTAVLELKRFLDDQNVRFVFLAYPAHNCVYEAGEQCSVPAVLDSLETRGVAGINLTAPLRASGRPTSELYLLPNDDHPSPLGYSVVAPVIADAILARLDTSRAKDEA